MATCCHSLVNRQARIVSSRMASNKVYRLDIRFVLTLLLLLCLNYSPAAAQSLVGTVTEVESGDTFLLKTSSGEEKIRLEGIDCPEMEQPYGDKAKAFTSRKILNRKITAEVISRDSFNGTWSVVRTPDGENLAEELLKAGLAWWYHKHSDDEALGKLETRARLKRKGLWADIAPMAPWDFRRGVWGGSR